MENIIELFNYQYKIDDIIEFLCKCGTIFHTDILQMIVKTYDSIDRNNSKTLDDIYIIIEFLLKEKHIISKDQYDTSWYMMKTIDENTLKFFQLFYSYGFPITTFHIHVLLKHMCVYTLPIFIFLHEQKILQPILFSYDKMKIISMLHENEWTLDIIYFLLQNNLLSPFQIENSMDREKEKDFLSFLLIDQSKPGILDMISILCELKFSFLCNNISYYITEVTERTIYIILLLKKYGFVFMYPIIEKSKLNSHSIHILEYELQHQVSFIIPYHNREVDYISYMYHFHPNNPYIITMIQLFSTYHVYIWNRIIEKQTFFQRCKLLSYDITSFTFIKNIIQSEYKWINHIDKNKKTVLDYFILKNNQYDIYELLLLLKNYGFIHWDHDCYLHMIIKYHIPESFISIYSLFHSFECKHINNKDKENKYILDYFIQHSHSNHPLKKNMYYILHNDYTAIENHHFSDIKIKWILHMYILQYIPIMKKDCNICYHEGNCIICKSNHTTCITCYETLHPIQCQFCQSSLLPWINENKS